METLENPVRGVLNAFTGFFWKNMKDKNSEVKNVDEIAEHWARLILSHIEIKKRKEKSMLANKKGRFMAPNNI
ncbi:hypothetical protein C4578_00715 [Candidatus Microgenomates bacterium]|nr:MAG: hypothetical protein C4578_00715 [Candidatus Microgenomates bacterium]